MSIILDPTDERVPVARQVTPRNGAITGSVALLDISKPRGNVLLDRLAEQLGQQLGHHHEARGLDALGERDDGHVRRDQVRHLEQRLARVLHRDRVEDEVGLGKGGRGVERRRDRLGEAPDPQHPTASRFLRRQRRWRDRP